LRVHNGFCFQSDRSATDAKRAARIASACAEQVALSVDDAILELRIARERGTEHRVTAFVVVDAGLTGCIDQDFGDQARSPNQQYRRKSKGRDCLNGRSRPPMLSSGMHRIPIPLLSRLHFLWWSRSRLCCTCGIGAVCRWWPGGVVVNVAARRWALRRADTEWTKQAAALRQARLMMRLRLIRRVWATCAACGAEYGYDARAHTFHRLARSGPPDDQGSSAACPLKL